MARWCFRWVWTCKRCLLFRLKFLSYWFLGSSSVLVLQNCRSGNAVHCKRNGMLLLLYMLLRSCLFFWIFVWLTDSRKDGLTHSLAVWLTDWLADWLSDWLTYWLSDCLTDWLTDWWTDGRTVWWSDWLIDCLFVCVMVTMNICCSFRWKKMLAVMMNGLVQRKKNQRSTIMAMALWWTTKRSSEVEQEQDTAFRFRSCNFHVFNLQVSRFTRFLNL